LVELKDVDWIKSVPSQSLQDVIDRLDKTYQNFFRGGGFPRWARRGKYNSILFKSVQLDGIWFSLPKLGRVKIFKDRLPNGKLKTATIKKQNNAYYLCVTFESQPKHLKPSENQVGLDVGIAHFLVDSDGCYVSNPKHFKQISKKLRREQRSLSRKKQGSNRWRKQKYKVSSLMSKTARAREDFLHKISKQYIQENGIIVCEKLNVKGMMASCKPKTDENGKFIPNGQKAKSGLNKSIADAGWSKFFSMLEYKSQLYGREFIQVVPKHTSQKCSVCGHIARENRLNQEKFVCVKCGFEENADYNASKNILRAGCPVIRQREALSLCVG
jgi:putative transposase